MARKAPATWLPLFLRALDEEIGIRFTVTGGTREYFRNELLEARKSAADPRLDGLIIFLPAGEAAGEIWICKKSVEMDE